MFTEMDDEDITKPFITPRTWETLSKAIYKAFERGEYNHMSDARIKSIIGDGPIFMAFKAHYERIPIDTKKVKDGSYSPSDFPNIDDKLYALSMIILDDSLDLPSAESFICDVLLSDEYLEIYRLMKNVRKAQLSK